MTHEVILKWPRIGEQLNTMPDTVKEVRKLFTLKLRPQFSNHIGHHINHAQIQIHACQKRKKTLIFLYLALTYCHRKSYTQSLSPLLSVKWEYQHLLLTSMFKKLMIMKQCNPYKRQKHVNMGHYQLGAGCPIDGHSGAFRIPLLPTCPTIC